MGAGKGGSGRAGPGLPDGPGWEHPGASVGSAGCFAYLASGTTSCARAQLVLHWLGNILSFPPASGCVGKMGDTSCLALGVSCGSGGLTAPSSPILSLGTGMVENVPAALCCWWLGGNVSMMIRQASLPGSMGPPLVTAAGGHAPHFGCLLWSWSRWLGKGAWDGFPSSWPPDLLGGCSPFHGERNFIFGPKELSWPRGGKVPVLGVHRDAKG